MAASKWPQVKDNLSLVVKLARDGQTEKQIHTQLRVGKTAWERYKKDYPELREALKKGKAPFLAEVENALAKRALGFEYEESKTYVKIESGKEVKYQEKTKKYYPPDVAACSILLKNKDKDENGRTRWSDNPAKMEIDRELANIRKRVEEMKLF
jgi:hypothetical protein